MDILDFFAGIVVYIYGLKGTGFIHVPAGYRVCMRNLIKILIFCLCANVALGGVIASEPSSGQAEFGGIWPTAGEEYRGGTTLRNVDYANGDWELGIDITPEMTEGGATQADFEWSAGLSLNYNSATEQATLTVDETSVVLQNPATLFTDMHSPLKGRPDSSQAYLSISNTTITVEGSEVAGIDDFAAGYGVADELRYIHINLPVEPLSDLDYVLAGTLYIDWTGTTPSQDEVGMNVKLTQIPEPASIIMVILVSVSGLFIRRRFRE